MLTEPRALLPAGKTQLEVLVLVPSLEMWGGTEDFGGTPTDLLLPSRSPCPWLAWLGLGMCVRSHSHCKLGGVLSGELVPSEQLAGPVGGRGVFRAPAPTVVSGCVCFQVMDL